MKKFNPNFMPLCKDVQKYIRESFRGRRDRLIAFKVARLRLRARNPRYSPFTTRLLPEDK